jgi:hypothetical protein
MKKERNHTFITGTSRGLGQALARHPYDGWGPYSVAPGVVDTQMQRRIREVDPNRFSRKEKFLRMKREDQLDSPDRAAAGLLDVLRREDLPGGPVSDLRDLD